MKTVLRLLLLLAVLLPAPARAHDLGASEAFLTEGPAGHYVLDVRVQSDYAYLFESPRLPERCGPVDFRPGSGQLTFTFDCLAAPLSLDDTLMLPWQREAVFLKVTWADGTTASRFFVAQGGVVPVDMALLQAASGSFTDAARRYTLLGIEHILFGVDHLLFVVSLLLIVRGPWMLLKTITAFTLAHSLTLALATLGLVNVPPAPVEACIALSIVLVAAEGLRETAHGAALRRPWRLAFAFGLLHGFGFAGALSGLGLPSSEIPLALLFFNIGVEIGQITFVATLLGLYHLVSRQIVALPRWTEAIPGYAIGSVAMLWFFERFATVLN
jgi:HupE / UreJ protein